MKNSTPKAPSTQTVFSLEDRPVTILCAFEQQGKISEVSWLCAGQTATGAVKRLDLGATSSGGIYITGGVHYDDRGLGRTELILQKDAQKKPDKRGPQVCDLLVELAEELVFAPTVILQWALIDLNPEFLAKAIAAGADVRNTLLEGMLTIDFAAAVTAAAATEVGRFFRNDEREYEWGEDFDSGCDAGFAGRAVVIRRMLREAGAIDPVAFRTAIRVRNFDYALSELLAGVPVNALSPKGLSPLVEALLRKDLTAVRWLLRHGANRHATADRRSRFHPQVDPGLAEHLLDTNAMCCLAPLTAACIAGFPEGLQALLTEGTEHPIAADYENLLNSCIPPDWALREIAAAGFDFASLDADYFVNWLKHPGPEACEALCELVRIAGPGTLSRPHWNLLNDLCRQPESHATLELLRMLLEAGVSPNRIEQGPRKNWTSELVESGEMTPDELSWYEEDLRSSKTLHGGESPLHIAIWAGNAATEALLLESGADAEALDDLRRKPDALRKPLPTEEPKSACASFLRGLDGEGNPKAWAEQNVPELLARTAEDPIALLELLGEWLDKADGDPKPHKLLLKAVHDNSLSLVELFLRVNPDPEEMGFALLAAMDHAEQLFEQCQDYLICRGSIMDPGPPAGYRETAATICTLLRNAGARDFTRLPAAARAGDLAAVREEIENGTPVNFDVYGWGTPLLAAIAGKQSAAVQALLDAGADPNFEFYTGRDDRDDAVIYPIRAALESGDVAILKAVLSGGADPEKGGVCRTALFECKIESPGVASLVFGGRDVFPRWRSTIGNTGVHLLDENSFLSCRHLVPVDALDARNYRAETPVLLALMRDDMRKAFALIEAGADPACYGGLSREHSQARHAYKAMPHNLGLICLNPMHTAILSGDILYVERMLEAGGRFDLPAFAATTPPAPDVLDRFRTDMRGFWPAAFPQDAVWREQWKNDRAHYDIHNATQVPGLETQESLLLQHFLSEDPGRASRYREFIVPMSCLDLAAVIRSTVVREMVATGRALEGRAFFNALREDIARLADRYRIALASPDAEKPRTYRCIREIRRIESALIMKVWDMTGELPPQADKDSAMECLRHAGSEFDGKFLDAIEKLDSTGELSMDEFIGGLEESLEPGSTVDLGKFFRNALATLDRFDRICESQW